MAQGSGRRSDLFHRHPVATTIAGACAAVALIIAGVLAVGLVGLLLGLHSLGRAEPSDPCDTAQLHAVHLAARADVQALDAWLDRHPRDVDRIDPNGTSVLSCAAQRGSLRTVHVLLEHDLDPRTPVAGRALVLAIQHDRAPVTKALLAGVDLSAPYAPSPRVPRRRCCPRLRRPRGRRGPHEDPDGSRRRSQPIPVCIAAAAGHRAGPWRDSGHPARGGANPDAGRVDPLIVVVATVEHPPPSERIVDLLNEFTSRIRSTSPMDHQHAAVRSDGARLGADALGTFNDQLTPFDPDRTVDAPPLAVAAAYQDAGLVRLLLTGGADPNRLALDGRSPIELAAMACDPTIVRMLADRGARVDVSRHDVRAEACATVRPLLPAH